jgi:hypothetical protein
MFQHLPSSGFNFAQLKISGVDVVWGPDDEIYLSFLAGVGAIFLPRYKLFFNILVLK